MLAPSSAARRGAGGSCLPALGQSERMASDLQAARKRSPCLALPTPPPQPRCLHTHLSRDAGSEMSAGLRPSRSPSLHWDPMDALPPKGPSTAATGTAAKQGSQVQVHGPPGRPLIPLLRDHASPQRHGTGTQSTPTGPRQMSPRGSQHHPTTLWVPLRRRWGRASPFLQDPGCTRPTPPPCQHLTMQMKMSFSAPRPRPHTNLLNNSFRNSHLSKMAQRKKVNFAFCSAERERERGVVALSIATVLWDGFCWEGCLDRGAPPDQRSLTNTRPMKSGGLCTGW